MNYGRFLKELLTVLHSWHQDKQKYESEAKGSGRPGFRKRWQSSADNSSKIDEADILQFDDFSQVLHKWHVRLIKSFLACLESGEYMKMKNSIIILDSIAEFFPTIKTLGVHFEAKVLAILAKETREDMKVLLNRYSATLRHWKERWITLEQFHKVSKAVMLQSSCS